MRFEPENFKKLPQSAFIPFGGGVRKCIGEQMAIYEILAVVVIILRKYSFRVKKGVEIEDEWSLTLSMTNGLPMHVTRR